MTNPSSVHSADASVSAQLAPRQIDDQRRRARVLLRYLTDDVAEMRSPDECRRLGELAAVIEDEGLTAAKATETLAILSTAALPATLESIGFSEDVKSGGVVGFSLRNPGLIAILLAGLTGDLLYVYMSLAQQATQTLLGSSNGPVPDMHSAQFPWILPIFRS